MTALYDPADPKYFDPVDLKAELDRVFDLCHGCRLCFNLCPSFPTLFEFIDQRDGEVSALTWAERDQVVDECYQCKLCYVKCPYVPPHEWELDFPRLMSRVHANRHREGASGGVGVGAGSSGTQKKPLRERAADQFLGRTDLLGHISTAASPLVNAATGKPGSFGRKLMEKSTGIAANRLLPPYAKQRFTTWFKKRSAQLTKGTVARGRKASVFPTCFIEYMDPPIGQDLVAVYEHNGITCSLPEGTKCCGAPWLHSGNVEKFEAEAAKNVAALARQVRDGHDIIVAQPTCSYVIKRDYPLYLKTADADLVAAHTFDPAEYLMRTHKGDDGPLDLEFPGREDGSVPDKVTYHVPCHLQAQNIGLKSRDLLKLAGVKCDLVQKCSGIDGTWGYRAENYELARKVARPMVREIEAAGNEVVCGDCHLANGAIVQETGVQPLHPIQLMARAYGLAPETPGGAG